MPFHTACTSYLSVLKRITENENERVMYAKYLLLRWSLKANWQRANAIGEPSFIKRFRQCLKKTNTHAHKLLNVIYPDAMRREQRSIAGAYLMESLRGQAGTDGLRPAGELEMRE